MEEIRISDVTAENVDDLCRVCIPPEKADDPVFITGREEKHKWAQEMLRMWGACAKLAYVGSTPVGLIQYKPVPRERVVYIHCIFVHEAGLGPGGENLPRLQGSQSALVRPPFRHLCGRVCLQPR